MIALDLDEVVFNFVDPFLDFLNKSRSTSFTRQDYTTYSFEDCGILPVGSTKEWVTKFGRAGGFRNLPLRSDFPLVWATRMLSRIVYITYRDFEFEDDTNYNLALYGIHQNVIYGDHETKPKYLDIKELGITFYVDDNPYAILDAVEHTGAKCILLNSKPHDQQLVEYTNAICTADWSEARLDIPVDQESGLVMYRI